MTYVAPLAEMMFALRHNAGLDALLDDGGSGLVAADVVAILGEAARLAENVIAPLNATGDREGCRWIDGDVHTPSGFKEAWQALASGGWLGLAFPPAHGGQGLPHAVAAATVEMWNSANMAFALAGMNNTGAADALLLGGTAAQCALYVPRLLSGESTGTMNLTEPQAGSDLSRIRTVAVRDGDHYRISGQKIYITWGEQDITANIVHLVLARIAGAPAGVRGISMFAVPKFLWRADGTLGRRNDVRCVSIENKLGLHGSPTAVMAYGDEGGAIGDLIGAENRGLETMFVMMNASRLATGLQGLAVTVRALQKARRHAADRVQGRHPEAPLGPAVTIDQHPDVARMLDTIGAHVAAMRALLMYTAGLIDRSESGTQGAAAAVSAEQLGLLTPLVKGWCTETAVRMTSLALQVHGGMGYIEETGAAQYLRDVRITTIYEGTTAIQANDLLARKIFRDGGAGFQGMLDEIEACACCAAASTRPSLTRLGEALGASACELRTLVLRIIVVQGVSASSAYAAAVPLLMTAGAAVAGWQLAASLLAADAVHELDGPVAQGLLVAAGNFADLGLSFAAGSAAEARALLARAPDQGVFRQREAA